MITINFRKLWYDQSVNDTLRQVYVGFLMIDFKLENTMIIRFVIPAIILVALAGCDIPVDSATQQVDEMATDTEFVRIMTAEQFGSLVVGKRLTLDDNYVVAAADGALTGNFGGNELVGTWEWLDGYFCRTLTTHSQGTDCQLWTVSGDTHFVTRDRGNGTSFTYIAE